MKRFRFKLEKALDLRLHRERETKIALGKAVGTLSFIEHNLEALARERLNAGEERFSPAYGTADILVHDLYIRRLEETQDRLLQEATAAELKVEEARDEYLEASRDRKVLDKIREKRWQEYKKAREDEAIKNLDDISGGVSARKMTAHGDL
ncbi:flagellar export protein FliJ [Treponema sp. TIM-1]|uniref:flagellar export protein FliJ n=1 Tax=Treponema sp. TIM-1 TaxID=2898417 RepID=UPI003980186C